MERIARHGAEGHLAAPDAVFHLSFFFSFRSPVAVTMPLQTDRRACVPSLHGSAAGRDTHAVYCSESGKYCVEIFSAGHGVKTFHAIIDNFSSASQVTPPAFRGQAHVARVAK